MSVRNDMESIMRRLSRPLALAIVVGALSTPPALAQDPSPSHVEAVKRIVDSAAYTSAENCRRVARRRGRQPRQTEFFNGIRP
jgi:hypothetical protein